MSNNRRSFRTPAGYKADPTGGRVALFDKVYVGKVKNNNDAFKMGRLQVWIPEFSKNPDDENQWFTVSYCSPFAGSSPVKSNVKNGQGQSDTQTSYGFWAVPPHLDNDVIVMFINGDPNRGIWMGSLYQQFMNHMVPGIPSNTSYKPGQNGNQPPVAEFNRWADDISNSDQHTRARFDDLHNGLMAQGLYDDASRGTTTAGARRDGVSNTYGFLSPGGSQFVFDDDDKSSYIRLRTKSGAQVVINDTIGFVYIISANGNSWFEVSDDGIDAYSAKTISMRSQGDMNFHSDNNMNFYAKGSWNVYAGGGASLQSGKDLNVLSAAATNISSAGDINLLGKGAANLTASGNLSVKANGTIALDSGGAMGINASGALNMKGSKIQQNGGSGPTATAAKEASGPKPAYADDRELASDHGQIQTNTIVSRMPSHEPWDGHPGSKSAAASAPVDLSSSRRVTLDGNSSDDGSKPTDVPADATQPPVQTDNTQFVAPITGPVTSIFGTRTLNGKSDFHPGVDVGVPIGTPIVAMADGTVCNAGPASGYGQWVRIKHDGGYMTLYGHISKYTVNVGDKVTKGQQIALSGNLGKSTGPHLHFGLYSNGTAIDPGTKLSNIKKGARLTAGRN